MSPLKIKGFFIFKMAGLSGYELSRAWFDFCFENPEKISPNHSAIYFFAIEHCNRLGWKTKFGFPTQMAMDAIGIKKHETYIRYFKDLCDWGFFILVEKSVNQYSSNIIALGNALPKNGEALGKAILTHAGKQSLPMRESNSSIDKPDNLITIKPDNQEIIFSIEECLRISLRDARWVEANKATENELISFNKVLEKRGVYEKNCADYKTHYANWKAGGKKEEQVNQKVESLPNTHDVIKKRGYY